ncbi:MAG TPA: hypothetical protein VLT85_04345 [Terriglobales bacterium]|nr:hypothetical protein [Terriglobales bacterium]
MDWKYKHFAEDAVFPAQPEAVVEAARAFAREYLADWRLADTPEGLELEGRSAAHAATAVFHIEPAPEGAKVAVTLRVERASWQGFMLVDAGGFYSRQIALWLKGIQSRLQHGPASATQNGVADPLKQAAYKPSRGPALFVGCAAIVCALFFVIWIIEALVGLATGNLYLIGRGGTAELHGVWARIVSAAILAGVGWIVLRIYRPPKSRQRRGGEWLPPP